MGSQQAKQPIKVEPLDVYQTQTVKRTQPQIRTVYSETSEKSENINVKPIRHNSNCHVTFLFTATNLFNNEKKDMRIYLI